MNENEHQTIAYGQYPCNLPFKSLKEFLKRLDQTMRWEEWLCAGKQLFSGVSLDDRQFECNLRAYILGKVLCLNIQDLPEAISDSIALREFMGSKDAYQVSIDKNLLTSFHERIHTTGLDELIDNEISFLVRLPDSNHSSEMGEEKSNAALMQSNALHEDQITVMNPNEDIQTFRYMMGSRTQPEDRLSILPSYYPPMWVDHHKHEKSELIMSAIPPADNEKQRDMSDKTQMQMNSSLPQRTIRPRNTNRQRRNMLPAALMMAAFITGTYFFGLMLYQRARDRIAGDISTFSFLAPTASPQPMSTETNTADFLRRSLGVASSSRAGLYDASEDIAANIAAVTKDVSPAHLIASDNDTMMKASVTIDGLMNYDTMRQLISLVKQHKVKVSFFPTAEQAAYTPNLIRTIIKAGLPVGIGVFYTEQDMMNKPLAELVADCTTAQRILHVITGRALTQIKGSVMEYPRNVLIAAGASGFCQAVKSTNALTYESFSSYEETLTWVKRLRPGSIVSVALPALPGMSEYHHLGRLGESPDNPSAFALSQTIDPDLMRARDRRVIQLISWLLQAIEEAELPVDSVPLSLED